MKNIGKTLKRLRLSRGFTQEQVARKAKVSRGALATFESEARSNMKLETAIRLATALDVTLDELVRR